MDFPHNKSKNIILVWQGYSFGKEPKDTYLALPERHSGKKEEGAFISPMKQLAVMHVFLTDGFLPAAPKGFARAQNFLLSFFKSSPETKIEVQSQEEEVSSLKIKRESRKTSKHNKSDDVPCFSRHVSGSKSGLLQYTVDNDSTADDDLSLSSSSVGSMSHLQSPTAIRKQSSMSRLSVRGGTLASDDGSDSSYRRHNVPHLPDINHASNGMQRSPAALCSRTPLGRPAMYGHSRLKDSVCLMLPPSNQDNERRPRDSGQAHWVAVPPNQVKIDMGTHGSIGTSLGHLTSRSNTGPLAEETEGWSARCSKDPQCRDFIGLAKHALLAESRSNRSFRDSSGEIDLSNGNFSRRSQGKSSSLELVRNPEGPAGDGFCRTQSKSGSFDIPRCTSLSSLRQLSMGTRGHDLSTGLLDDRSSHHRTSLVSTQGSASGRSARGSDRDVGFHVGEIEAGDRCDKLLTGAVDALHRIQKSTDAGE